VWLMRRDFSRIEGKAPGYPQTIAGHYHTYFYLYTRYNHMKISTISINVQFNFEGKTPGIQAQTWIDWVRPYLGLTPLP
jgi:hypothetical protein